jgi:sugar diacid utilization regulator
MILFALTTVLLAGKAYESGETIDTSVVFADLEEKDVNSRIADMVSRGLVQSEEEAKATPEAAQKLGKELAKSKAEVIKLKEAAEKTTELVDEQKKKIETLEAEIVTLKESTILDELKKRNDELADGFELFVPKTPEALTTYSDEQIEAVAAFLKLETKTRKDAEKQILAAAVKPE